MLLGGGTTQVILMFFDPLESSWSSFHVFKCCTKKSPRKIWTSQEITKKKYQPQKRKIHLQHIYSPISRKGRGVSKRRPPNETSLELGGWKLTFAFVSFWKRKPRIFQYTKGTTHFLTRNDHGANLLVFCWNLFWKFMEIQSFLETGSLEATGSPMNIEAVRILYQHIRSYKFQKQLQTNYDWRSEFSKAARDKWFVQQP